MSNIPLRDRPITGTEVAAFNLADAHDGAAVCQLLAACVPADRQEVCAWISKETGASWSPAILRTVFILGAADAEMSAIETLLRACGQAAHYALAASGHRVAPGQPAVTYEGVPEVPPQEVVSIEVAGPWGQSAIDHHDGSERASWGPERFLQASSLGQVIERLAGMGIPVPAGWVEPGADSGGLDHGGGWIPPYMYAGPSTGWTGNGERWKIWWATGAMPIWRVVEVPMDLIHEAAADHCPAAAIAGLCPGVDPGAFAPFLAESKRAQYFPAMSAEDFARELATSRATLLAAPPCLALTGYLAVPQPLPSWTIEGAVPADYLPGELLAPVRIESLSGMWTLVQAPTPDGTPTATYIPTEYAAVRDLRHLEPGVVPAAGSGECYPAEFLVGIVAALFEGIGFVCRIRRRDGKLALRSNGHGQGTAAGTRPAEIFLADPSAFGCGPTQPPGQDASYGNPVRGFFGGTLIDQG